MNVHQTRSLAVLFRAEITGERAHSQNFNVVKYIPQNVL